MTMQSSHDAAAQIADMMEGLVNMNLRQRIGLRNRTERLSQLLGWNVLSEQYKKARALALKRLIDPAAVAPPAAEMRLHRGSSVPDLLKHQQP